MILALDVGNSQIFGAVFAGEELLFQFRKTSKMAFSSDELGIFLRAVLRENEINYKSIQQIALCSVVPDIIHSLKNCCLKYFEITPFILQAGVKTGLKIKYRNPIEVGSDRIANSIGAVALYPQRNIIIVDFGTATTFCAINQEKEYLGGIICAGLRISMEALESQTAKLPSVEIIKPEAVIGKTTIESIQSGLFYGHKAMVVELCKEISREAFGQQKPYIIGTGGFARLFEKSGIFDEIIPDLVLKGLLIALKNNI